MIKLGMVGHIMSGVDQNSWVRVQELPDDPPSFLILLATDHDFHTGIGDYWVEDYPSLEQFFEESQWVVDWDE